MIKVLYQRYSLRANFKPRNHYWISDFQFLRNNKLLYSKTAKGIETIVLKVQNKQYIIYFLTIILSEKFFSLL